MLVLTRQRNESVMIGDRVEVMVVEIRGDKVRLGFQAPDDVPVYRKEIYESIKEQNVAAAVMPPKDLRAVEELLREGLRRHEEEERKEKDG